MPKRIDIKKILIIGAGPIVIGQACEFDYSGAQACKSLKEEGYKVILINSNPATIMTDPDLADKTYIEPITKDFVKQIIELEKPDALLPTMGGQTALNVSMELSKSGVLQKNNVKIQMSSANKVGALGPCPDHSWGPGLWGLCFGPLGPFMSALLGPSGPFVSSLSDPFAPPHWVHLGP